MLPLQAVGPGRGEHDCWTTTETALTQDLSGDLQDAWERLRETAVSFGDQRIYASHKSVMFSRKSCYFSDQTYMRRSISAALSSSNSARRTSSKRASKSSTRIRFFSAPWKS